MKLMAWGNPNPYICVHLLGIALLRWEGLGRKSHAGSVQFGNYTHTPLNYLTSFLPLFSFTIRLVINFKLNFIYEFPTLKEIAIRTYFFIYGKGYYNKLFNLDFVKVFQQNHGYTKKSFTLLVYIQL